jgi:MFS family permease
VLGIVLAVGVAFADSSIVVLALPELYVDLDASIFGISWVITSFNAVVAAACFALLPVVRRLRPYGAAAGGVAVFLAGSIGCGASGSLGALIAFRSVQGLGAALLLAVSLPLLERLTGSARRAVALWAAAGTAGAALGPAAGGVLTELFSWRAIFWVQAPVAALALVSALDGRVRSPGAEGARPRSGGVTAANVSLALLFAALVGALFLAVLLVVTVWDEGPLTGAGIVSALPLSALAVRRLSHHLPYAAEVAGGSLLVAAGLVALGVLPAATPAYAVPALAVCGAGLGLAAPPLTRRSVGAGARLAWSGTLSVAGRHAGLVTGLLLVAPVLAWELDRGGERAMLNATAVVLDASVPLERKIPIALDLRDEFERTPSGAIPDLESPFDRNDAGNDPTVAATRDGLFGTIEAALTRSFRTSFLLAGLLALLGIVPGLAARRQQESVG